MPFADGTFAGAYLRWVLHLIPTGATRSPRWRAVVNARGACCSSISARTTSRPPRSGAGSAEITGVQTDPVGLMWGELDELDATMEALGATLRLLPSIPEEGEETLGEFLEGIAEGRWSWTWNASEDARLNAVEELRPWAEERYGPLDPGRPVRARDGLARLRPALAAARRRDRPAMPFAICGLAGAACWNHRCRRRHQHRRRHGSAGASVGEGIANRGVPPGTGP
jgi:hypothetical protein